MLFNSIIFSLFFPFTCILYFALPQDKRNVWLLIASFLFYMYQEPAYALLLLFSIIVTYTAGSFMGRCPRNSLKRKGILTLSIVLDLGLLLFFKYSGYILPFFSGNTLKSLVLPAGISFYVFQTLGYAIDVYRGKQQPSKSLFRYSLFVSFFPQLLSGPISRAHDLLPQFDEEHTPDYERIRLGLFRMLTGYFMKLVIASRLTIATDLIFNNYSDVNGLTLTLGIFLFALQIYCDFASYSHLAIGSALVMGFKLTENFRQPFFSESPSKLWRRWHISLNSWFRDYLYIPLGGNRKGLFRKRLNTLIIFTASGIWHGAGLTYPCWGFLSGLFVVIEDMIKSLSKDRLEPLHIKERPPFHHIIKIALTMLLFMASLIFFKAPDIHAALTIYGKIFTEFLSPGGQNYSIFSLGLGVKNMLVLIFSLGLLFLYDLMNERTGDAAGLILSQKKAFRWAIYYLIVILILLSTNIGASEFIYFKF